MRMFRYPVRPLTALGRVLLCIALSVVAALLLMVSPPTRADDLAGLDAAASIQTENMSSALPGTGGSSQSGSRGDEGRVSHPADPAPWIALATVAGIVVATLAQARRRA